MFRKSGAQLNFPFLAGILFKHCSDLTYTEAAQTLDKVELKQRKNALYF